MVIFETISLTWPWS